MKPLLIVVPLHPQRECRAKTWLEKESDIADIKYLTVIGTGPPIYGKGGQLYTNAALHKAVFEAVYTEWQKTHHKFFGVCLDDVVVKKEGVLRECLKFLEENIMAVGVVAPEIKKIDGQTVLMRFWITHTDALRHTSYDQLFQTYVPDWEPAWLRFSNLTCCPLPNLNYEHLLPEWRLVQLTAEG